MVTETLSLLDIPPRAREAAEALGVTSKSILLQVLKGSASEGEMIALLEEISERGLTRDDLRRSAPAKARGGAGGRRKPYTFKFRDPDKTFNLSLTFRKSTVDRGDLITALERILLELRNAEKSDAS